MSIRVLVADDDEEIRGQLREALQGADMDVVEAVDGDEALALAASTNPDVAVLDWLMPAGGLVLVRRLASDHHMANRIVMLSGLADVRDRRAARASGAGHYLVKPPQREALIEAIEQAARGAPEPDTAGVGPSKEVHDHSRRPDGTVWRSVRWRGAGSPPGAIARIFAP
jgi:two-component system, OmpR family, response regulator